MNCKWIATKLKNIDKPPTRQLHRNTEQFYFSSWGWRSILGNPEAWNGENILSLHSDIANHTFPKVPFRKNLLYGYFQLSAFNLNPCVRSCLDSLLRMPFLNKSQAFLRLHSSTKPWAALMLLYINAFMLLIVRLCCGRSPSGPALFCECRRKARTVVNLLSNSC